MIKLINVVFNAHVPLIATYMSTFLTLKCDA